MKPVRSMGEVLTCRMAQVLWASNETQIPFVHSLSVRGPAPPAS